MKILGKGSLFPGSFKLPGGPTLSLTNTHLQLIFIRHGCHICELAYLLKFICNLQSSIHVLLLICGHVQKADTLRLQMPTFPDKAKQDDLRPRFSNHAIKSIRYMVYFMPHFPHFCAVCVCVCVRTLKMPPSLVPKCHPALYGENAYVRQMSYTAVSHEFSVNESTVYIK